MKRIALVICLASVLLLALAAPAFADTSGTIYGKAVLAPYAIVITGGGTDPSSPLTYQGTLGSFAQEEYDARVVIQNTGTQDARIMADVNGLPSDGASTWNLGSPGLGNPDTAEWFFGTEDSGSYSHLFWVLAPSDPYYGQLSECPSVLSSGDSLTLGSVFHFPTSTSSMGDHYMSATFSAVAPD
jgi:hypothetical protein